MSAVALTDFISQLEAEAPRLYSRWSPQAWRLACEGPALRLWEGLARDRHREAALGDYLYLLREAVGLQYLSAASAADLNPRNPRGAGASFLAVALCDALPRLLPASPPRERAAAMAALWNVGERLASKPAWLNRYLAAQLVELEAIGDIEGFLEKALLEGLEKAPRAAWRGPVSWTTLDLSAFDRVFLPGRLHLATPAIACVHDRRLPDRHLAILLRRAARGGPVCLGATPCLHDDGSPPCFEPKPAVLRAAFADPALPERFLHLATRSGHLLYLSPLSQRLWIGETKS